MTALSRFIVKERYVLELAKTNPYPGNIIDRKCAFLMFSDKLSSSLLLLCGTNGLSYESASEICGMSPRYFGRIVRKESAPTITVLENICTGFDKSPNELLGYPVLVRADVHSIPKAVAFTRCYHTSHGLTMFPVCPGCGCTLEREYQNFCDRCGQMLDWASYAQTAIILP